MLKIKIIGQYSKKNEQILNKISFKAKKDMVELGIRTVDTMQQEIKNAKRRSGGSERLEKSIKSYVEILKDIIMVGVAKISELPVYWRAVNYGSSHIIGKPVPGSFDGDKPASGKAGQRFKYERNTYSMIPGKPIPAMNFVERTVAKIRGMLMSMLRR